MVLSSSIKIQICPPFGKPFLHVPMQTIEKITDHDLQNLRTYCYLAMDQLLNKAQQTEHQCLGSYYILCALTLVNQEVAEAMPWLYQSVL